MESGEGESNIAYVIYENHRGVLTTTSTPVWTHQCGDRSQDYYRGLEIDHDNYLDSLLYVKEKTSMVYKTYDCDLKTRIHNQDLFDVYQISRKKGDPIVSRFLKPEYREILRSMVQLLVELHHSGYSLTGFNMSNIVFKKNKLKYAAVGFHDTSRDRRKEDFNCLHQIVTEMFQGTQQQQHPMELQRWIELLSGLGCKRRDCGLILLHHLAVMSPRKSVQFFKSCDERISKLSTEDLDRHMKAIDQMPDCSNWHNRFTPVTDKVDLLTDSCFRRNIKNYDFTVDPKKNITLASVKRSLLRCCRNLAVHLQDNTKIQLSDLHIERMILHVLGEDLLTLQLKLNMKKCLLPFVLEN